MTDTPEYVTAVLGHTWASEVGELRLKLSHKNKNTEPIDLMKPSATAELQGGISQGEALVHRYPGHPRLRQMPQLQILLQQCKQKENKRCQIYMLWFLNCNTLSSLLLNFQQKIYTSAWDKIKAKSYRIPHDSHALQHAKQQKVILSNVRSTLYYNVFRIILIFQLLWLSPFTN